VETDPRLKVIRLRRNFGQTAALSAGFDEAQGGIVVSLDGDLQHDPEDIPALLAKIDEGYDIASGWRKERIDNAFTRRIPSRVANWLMARISGVELRDFGTTFKAYRAEVLKDVNLYGELHRFIPALASFLRSAHSRGAHPQHAPPDRAVPLWAGAHVQRAIRYHHNQVPAEIFHPADAIFLEDRPDCHHRRRWPAGHACHPQTMGHGMLEEHGPLMFFGCTADYCRPDDVQYGAVGEV